jgi:putative endonuclease
VVEWQTCLPAGRRAKEMYYTYAIKSKVRNYIYVGLSNNPDRRISEHNDRKEKTTRSYAPFMTILIEKHQSRAEARKREKYLKSGIGKEYLKSL